MKTNGESEAIVITGIGCLTPLGANVDETWQGLCQGRSAVGPITRFDARKYPVTFAAEVPEFEAPNLPGRFGRWADDKSRFALTAVAEAWADSGLNDAAVAPERVGVSVGAEVSRPSLEQIATQLNRVVSDGAEKAYRAADPKDFAVMSAFFRPPLYRPM